MWYTGRAHLKNFHGKLETVCLVSLLSLLVALGMHTTLIVTMRVVCIPKICNVTLIRLGSWAFSYSPLLLPFSFILDTDLSISGEISPAVI